MWDLSPDGINVGGWGLNVRTKDIASLGQLYLQKGLWKGERLISEAWVEEATSLQTSNGSSPESDWDQGYGYQFWQCRHGLYRGDGAFGQYCIVMPEQDVVVAITSGTNDMQAIMNLVVNSRDAMPDGGTLTLSADTEAADGRVVVRITDTGSGIGEEERGHIFEPFYTTKTEHGNGLGLAVVSSIVEEHGGHISVESALGEWTTFKVSMPAVRPEENVKRTISTAPAYHDWSDD